jgi:hypothetical protein
LRSGMLRHGRAEAAFGRRHRPNVANKALTCWASRAQFRLA